MHNAAYKRFVPAAWDSQNEPNGGIGMKSYIQKFICLLWIFGVFFCMPDKAVAAETVDFEQIKKGIVEIQSGFYDSTGAFRMVNSGSGFLLSNAEGKTYIIVGNSIAQTSKSEAEQFCGKQKIDIENLSFDNVTKVVVKGDVTADVSLDTDSERKDFAILSTGNVLNEKKSLRLREDFKWETGKKIYLLAFRQKKENQEYISADVNMYQGEIVNRDVSLDNEYSFNFSAELPEDCTGGVLLDEEGYVVGIRNDEMSDATNDYHAATSITEIIEVLDNWNIYYDSALKDQKRDELKELYQECMQMCDSGLYKKKSVQEMQTALEKVKALESMTEVSLESTQEAYEQLQGEKEGMVRKMETIRIIFWMLAGVIVILLVWLAQLLVRNYLDKKKEEKKGDEQTSRRRKQTSDTERGQRVAQTYQKSLENQQSKGIAQQNLEKNSQNMNCQQRDRQEREQDTSDRYAGVRFSNEPQWEDNGSMDFRVSEQKQKEILLSLIRVSSGEKFTLSQKRAIIGKGMDADIQIKGNTAVSRKHAEIRRVDGGYCIRDMESLNGTFVNGRKMHPMESQRISGGDEVVLANEKFVIRNSGK